jgi:hypothetical protein
MDSQGQLAVRICCLFTQLLLLEPLARPAEARAERELLVRIPKRVKQAAHSVRSLASGADDAQGGGGFGLTRLDALEKDALELAAVMRAVGVNAATAAFESGARLRQVGWA